MAPEGLVASKVLGLSGPVWRSLDVLFAQWLLGRTFGHAVAATHSVPVGEPSKAANPHRRNACTQQLLLQVAYHTNGRHVPRSLPAVTEQFGVIPHDHNLFPRVHQRSCHLYDSLL